MLLFHFLFFAFQCSSTPSCSFEFEFWAVFSTSLCSSPSAYTLLLSLSFDISICLQSVSDIKIRLQVDVCNQRWRIFPLGSDAIQCARIPIKYSMWGWVFPHFSSQLAATTLTLTFFLALYKFWHDFCGYITRYTPLMHLLSLLVVAAGYIRFVSFLQPFSLTPSPGCSIILSSISKW